MAAEAGLEAAAAASVDSVAAVRVEAAQAAVGKSEANMAAGNNIPEKLLNEFVARVQQAGGANVQSVILYGSAVTGEYDPGFSNLNLLCIVRETTLPQLQMLAPTVEWWTKQHHPAPLMITQEELVNSADVFTIELLDIRRQHRVLFGPDVIGTLEIPMHLHRAQLEYELREKLILLRQRLLLASGDKERMWELLLRSLPAFATLFRHAVIAQGLPAPPTKREAIQALAVNLALDASPIEHLLDIREHRAEPKQFDVMQQAARYLAAIEQITAAVDKMLDRPRA
jgi:hypothetical protein